MVIAQPLGDLLSERIAERTLSLGTPKTWLVFCCLVRTVLRTMYDPSRFFDLRSGCCNAYVR